MDRIATGDIALGGADAGANAADLVAGGVDALFLRGGAGGNQGEGREEGEVFHFRVFPFGCASEAECWGFEGGSQMWGADSQV